VLEVPEPLLELDEDVDPDGEPVVLLLELEGALVPVCGPAAVCRAVPAGRVVVALLRLDELPVAWLEAVPPDEPLFV
tara:strand:- start:152 stop:382 length:231 start_codon:yes stop_codon:yes gene_type:complete